MNLGLDTTYSPGMARHSISDDQAQERTPGVILFVCTGNIHRSAMAQCLTQSRIKPLLPIVVGSAGMRAVVGHPMGAHSQVAVRELGADPQGHQARQFIPAMATEASLILTAESRHREQILEDLPTAMRRTFTLREFVRLSRTIPVSTPDVTRTCEQMQVQIARIAAQRGRMPVSGAGDDIADPLRASLEDTRRCAGEISGCVDAVIATLGLAGP